MAKVYSVSGSNMDIPPDAQTIRFSESMFDNDLGSIPNTVSGIEFISNIDFYIRPGSIPLSITYIYINRITYEQDPMCLPANLQHLDMPADLYTQNIVIPDSVSHLVFRGCVIYIPERLPPYLTKLELYTYGGPISSHVLPDTIECLQLCHNMVISGNTLPSKLGVISVYESIVKTFPDIDIFTGITKLVLHRPEHISCSMFPDITSLVFGDNVFQTDYISELPCHVDIYWKLGLGCDGYIGRVDFENLKHKLYITSPEPVCFDNRDYLTIHTSEIDQSYFQYEIVNPANRPSLLKSARK